MRDDARLRGLSLAVDVGDDHSTVLADSHLRPMVLTDPHPLGEAEGCRQPRNGSANVRVHEDGVTGADGIERFVSIARRLEPTHIARRRGNGKSRRAAQDAADGMLGAVPRFAQLAVGT